MKSSNDSKDSFRDNLATIDTAGKRLWVYPHQPKGRLCNARTVVSIFLILFYLSAPFIRVGSNPLLLFDILGRRFFILGSAFWPHDFHLVVLGVITAAVFVILFTAAFGRLFCGWACPQTIFLEMVFRKIEFWIEGNGPKQRLLDKTQWTAEKVIKKTAKYSIFMLISFILGNVTLSYFVGSEKLISFVTESPALHPAGFAFVVIFTLITYGVFSRFREQVCTLVCPYGRLQSVLLDNNSIVVAYDFKRGEPRGKIKKGETFENRGDCIDCDLCVHVCPTGIDIRNGTQLECVNCTACIDACNSVMEKMKRPLKLIRYSSFNGIKNGQTFKFSGRLAGYSTALVVLLSIIGLLSIGRADVETTILRTTGSLYEQLESGIIRNLYTVKILNRSSEAREFGLRLKHPEGELKLVGPALKADGQSNTESVFVVEIAPDNLFSANTMLTVEIMYEGKVLEEIITSFNGPEDLWKK